MVPPQSEEGTQHVSSLNNEEQNYYNNIVSNPETLSIDTHNHDIHGHTIAIKNRGEEIDNLSDRGQKY